MRKLAQLLLISLGCFAVCGVHADEATSTESVVSSDGNDSKECSAPSHTHNDDCGCGKPKI